MLWKRWRGAAEAARSTGQRAWLSLVAPSDACARQRRPSPPTRPLDAAGAPHKRRRAQHDARGGGAARLTPLLVASSTTRRFVTNNFKPYSESTIGASFMAKMMIIDNTPIKYQIWDTAGQEKYHSLAPMYYRGAAAAIVVYDITRATSFATLKTWVRELKQLGPEDIVIAIAGNKSDLAPQREVRAPPRACARFAPPR